MIFFNPIFFGSIAIRTIYILQTIEIDQDVWKIRYFLRREQVFSIADMEYIHKKDALSYRWSIPVTMITVGLNNSRRIRISSNEMEDFEKLERFLNQKEYTGLRKKK